MRDLYQKGEKFLKELQRSDDKRKKRWLIGGSTLTIFLVIVMWLLYLNASLPKLSVEFEASPKINKSATTPPLKESRLKIFFHGLAIVGDNLKEKIQDLKDTAVNYWNFFKERFSKNNEFILRSKEFKFNINDQEPVPKTPLP